MFDRHLVFGMVATRAPTKSNCPMEQSTAHDAMIYIVCFDPQGTLISIKSHRDRITRNPGNDNNDIAIVVILLATR